MSSKVAFGENSTPVIRPNGEILATGAGSGAGIGMGSVDMRGLLHHRIEDIRFWGLLRKG
jgi:hypothetical protein